MFEGDHDFSPELVRITQSFLDRLKEQGLVPNIISRLRVQLLLESLMGFRQPYSHSDQALSKLKLSLYSPQIDSEIRLISLVLFYIEVNTGIDSKAQARVESPNAIALSALTGALIRLLRVRPLMFSEEMSVAIPSVRLHQEHHQQVLSHCHSITTVIEHDRTDPSPDVIPVDLCPVHNLDPCHDGLWRRHVACLDLRRAAIAAGQFAQGA